MCSFALKKESGYTTTIGTTIVSREVLSANRLAAEAKATNKEDGIGDLVYVGMTEL